MSHLGRVHRIAVAWLHERWDDGCFTLFYEKSDLMAADIYTKGFTDKVKWQSVCGLINVVDPKRLNDTIRANSETKIRLEEEDVAKKAAKDAIVPLVNPTKAKGKKKKKGACTTGGAAAIGGATADASLSSNIPALATIARASRDINARRQLVEICCGPNSYLGQMTGYSEGCEVTRITRDIDFTTAAGVQAACNAVLGSRCAVWFSIPCIGGCPWQIVNINKGPEAVRRIRGYWALFTTMFRNALQVMAVAQAVGATIVIEWPRACRYWHHDRVKRAIQNFGLQIYDFDGCMYGIKSTLPLTKGTPIRKPWRIATNCPIIGAAFSIKCDGSHPHTPCQGGDTKQTEDYSRRFADRFHRAFRASCSGKFGGDTSSPNIDAAISAKDEGRCALSPP